MGQTPVGTGTGSVPSPAPSGCAETPRIWGLFFFFGSPAGWRQRSFPRDAPCVVLCHPNWRGLCGAVARSASRLCSQGARGLSFNSSIPPRHGLTALAAARAPGRSWPKVTPELLGVPAPRTFGEEGSGSPSENPFLIQQQEKRIFSYFSNDRKSHLGSSHLHRAPPKSPHPLLALPLPAQAASRTLGCTPAARGHPRTPKGAQITSPRITFPLANRF